MFRPRATYARLRREGPDGAPLALLVRRPLFLLIVMGAFVSFSSAGRLTAVHLMGTLVFWSFVSVLQMIAVALITATMTKTGGSVARAVDLFFVGQGPWLLFFTLLAGVCLFAPDVYGSFVWLLSTGVLPGAFLVTFAWGALLTWFFLRRGLEMGVLRALAGGAMYFLLYGGAIVGYFALTNQIQPLVLG